MVDVTVTRSKGVNVTVDKKDSGEVVSSNQDTPTLINAGVASQIISSLSLSNLTNAYPRTVPQIIVGNINPAHTYI